MTLFLHYFWMALQFLIPLAVVILVNQAFRFAIVLRFPAGERDHSFLSGIADVAISALLFWLAFWHEPLVWGIAAALVLIALGWIRFNLLRPVN